MITSPHIHIPFERVSEYLDLVVENRIDLEVFIKGDVLDSLDYNDVKALKNRLKHNPSISVHGPFMDLSPGAVDNKIRSVTMDRFNEALTVAEILGAKAVVFHSGYEKWRYALDANLWLEMSLKTWIPINKRASEAGIKIAIENIFEDEPSNLKMLMEAMDSANFGICFDTGHFNIFSKTPLVDWLDSLRPYIVELHIHDNDTTFDQHRPIGEGSFDFVTFFKQLKRQDLIITLENHSPADVLKSLQALSSYIAIENPKGENPC